mmetsp:Transcript_43556/g.117474  ORF Transcript_43556/g.117474 Transcript_43556/m.117474 type:complete len:519 (-) Transcript_43556:98-1654(-)
MAQRKRQQLEQAAARKGAIDGSTNSLQSAEVASAATQDGVASVSIGSIGVSSVSLHGGEDSSPMASSSVSNKGSWRQATSRLARCCPCCPCVKNMRRRLHVSVAEEVDEPAAEDQVPTSLLTAAHFGTKEKALEFLSSASAEELTETDSSGRSALHHAARRGFLELCNAIVDRDGADQGFVVGRLRSNSRGSQDQSPMLPAPAASSSSRLGRRGTLQQLIRRNTRIECVNARDGNGCTALHAAAAEGQSDVCSWLLQKDRFAEADRQDTCGQTALHHAAVNNHAKTCEVLLEALSPGRFTSYWTFGAVLTKDADGRSALHCAADKGSTEACRLLCKHRRTAALARATDEGGWTPLHCASRSGHVECSNVLLHSANSVRGLLEAAEADGRTPLHLAAMANKPQVCNALLDCWGLQRLGQGELNSFLRMAYHTVVNDPALESAARSGANMRDRHGHTALHLAARAGALKCCEALLQHPAFDAESAVDARGRTAADVATGKAKHLLGRARDDLRAFQRAWC